MPLSIKGQKGRRMQQRFKVQIRTFTHHFNGKRKGGADGFVTTEGQHFQRVRAGLRGQAETVMGVHPSIL